MSENLERMDYDLEGGRLYIGGHPVGPLEDAVPEYNSLRDRCELAEKRLEAMQDLHEYYTQGGLDRATEEALLAAARKLGAIE